jgi:hypothetical protein
MRIWRLADPADDSYATAGRRGSWTEPTGVGPCPECSASRQQRAQPLVMVWEPGSDVIGDFVWPGFGSEVVVTDPVLVRLSRFTGFEPGPLEFVDEPDLGSGPGRRVGLPYAGPELHELWTTTWIDADLERSTMEQEGSCSACGFESWHVDGVEHWDTAWDTHEQELERTRVARAAGRGVYVRGADLGGADIFRVRQLPGWVLCTDMVRDLVRERRFSNVDFLEMGDAT